MKTLLTLITLVSLTACTLPSIGDSNPLDVPGASEPSAEQLHNTNIRAITGNPIHPN